MVLAKLDVCMQKDPDRAIFISAAQNSTSDGSDLNMKPGKLKREEKVIGEKVGTSFECSGTGKEIMNRTLFGQALNSAVNKQALIKLRSSYMAKGTIIWIKHQAAEWDKIFPTTHSVED